MRKYSTALVLVIAALAICSPAQAHLVTQPKGGSLKARAASQKENLAHAKYVCRHGKGEHKRWSCHAFKGWLQREYKETQTLLQPLPSSSMAVTTATWYGPGFYGNRTACGQTLTLGSMWVASMVHGCGTKLTICTSVCFRTTVQDTGAFDPANFDLAPGLARALGCYCTQTVRWRLGW